MTSIQPDSLASQDWLTQQADMKTATNIINKHLDFNDGKPLAVLHVIMDHQSSQPLTIQVQDWVKELLEYFRDQYGWQEGETITGRVITRLLLQGETIH
jgi:hypothetical protein